MKKELFIIVLLICILANIIRAVYEILKHKKRLTANKLTFVIVFINMLLLWMSWFALCAFDIHKTEIINVIRYSGIALAGIGVVIFLTALFTIKSLESYEGDLITTGIYSITRHPMYLAFILWIIGLPVYFEALTALYLSLLFIANILFWRYLEEKELVYRFPAYKEYRKRTLF